MRTRIIIIGIIVFVILSGVGLITWQQKQIKTLTIEKEQMTQFALDSGRQARQYKNDKGRVISVNKILALTVRNTRAIAANREFQILKELDGVRKNLKNVESVVHIQAAALIKFKVPTRDSIAIVKGDTVKGRFFSYQDKYNFVNALSLPDSTQATGEIQVPFDGGVYWIRKHKLIFKNWRYGKKEYFSALTSPNPWVFIKQHEIIQVSKHVE